MNLRTKESGSFSVVGLILATLLAWGLFFARIEYPELKSVHEARVVVTAENMVRSGDWIVPVFNGRIRLEKPPLPYWVVAAARSIAGTMEERVFRLPSALLGLAGVLMAAACSAQLFGRRAGLLTVLFLSLTLSYLIESRSAEVDIYLAFTVTLSLLIVSSIFWGEPRRDWLWPALGASAALGTLAKGPVVFFFVVPMAVWAFWLFPDRRPRFGWLLGALLVFAGLSLFWPFLLIQRLGLKTVRQVWFSDILRNVEAGVNSRRPFYFYLTQFPLATFPWSVPAAAAVFLPLWKEVRPDRDLQRKTLWLSLTIAAAVLCFSFVGKKKIDYLAPLLPMAGILTAAAWGQISRNLQQNAPSARFNQGLLVGQAALVILAGLAVAGYAVFDPFRRTVFLLTAGAGLILGGAVSIWFLFRKKLSAVLISQSAGLLVGGYVLFCFLLPREDVRLSPARFCQQVRQVIGDSPIAYFEGKDETLVYHLRRPIPSLSGTERLEEFLRSHPDGFVIVRGEKLAQARQAAPHIVFFYPLEKRDILLPSLRASRLDEDDQEPEDVSGEIGNYSGLYILTAKEWPSAPVEYPSVEAVFPPWLTMELLWVVFGLAAQTLFFLRFFVQWIASEKAGQSVVPVVFWWFSLAGGLMLLVYSLYRRDPVFIFGQSAGVFIYLRNLWLIYKQRLAEVSSEPSLSAEDSEGRRSDAKKPAAESN
ncbi:MAG TPA: lipid-A-disaccharide synthase N-terminal domain-containing protein [Anaerohalosphaeraceae bacterium]|nr:lipid-A-disaccharide synthase N-terminal domain-containing protein [Anaerohalosphaeraceae bacterium]